MIELSVVTGTYNRLQSLKRMVSSVRRSVGDFHHYEIVLVDGGSTDGTIAWCKRQADVILIEQGELLGAVKAFNAGAQAARGRYVVLANDDVYFVDESLLRAIAFMDQHPQVGIGCFYQNRGGKDWHVEMMPAIDPDGRQCSAWYGQVCIVPKWLGDEVGWWGDYLHTYGGDNELSCMVYENGYHITPIPCACIADMMIHDELRDINGGDPRAVSRQGVVHPDSRAWSDKWRHDNGRTGPRISTTPMFDYRNERKMRIMYMPLFEPGNDLQRATKVGLRKSLEKYGMVVQWDYMRDGLNGMLDYAAAWEPDLFVWQIQNTSEYLNANLMRVLRQEHPNAKMVNWNGDYHPENLFDEGYMEMMTHFDACGFITTQVAKAYADRNIDWFYWQIGYEESNAQPLPDTPEYDVVYLGNGYNATRIALGKFLAGLRGKGHVVGIYGNWPPSIAQGSNLYDFDSGQRLYKNAKLIISTQMYPKAVGFVSNRLFQALASGGGMVLQQKFEGMEYHLGLYNGKHLVTWETHEELEQLIEEYLHKDTKRKRIAKAGTNYVLTYHSFDVRVKEMFDVLGGPEACIQ